MPTDEPDRWAVVDAWLAELERRGAAQKKWKKENTFAVYLIGALPRYPAGLGTTYVYNRVRTHCLEREKNIPAQFEAVVRSSYNQHCENSSVFQRSGQPVSEAIFKTVARGKWSVIPDRADVDEG